MRIYSSLIVLSLLSLSLSVNSQSKTYGSATKHQSTTLSQLLAATQTGLEGEQSPDGRRGSRRNFSYSGQLPTSELCHRGSGRRELSRSPTILTT